MLLTLNHDTHQTPWPGDAWWNGGWWWDWLVLVLVSEGSIIPRTAQQPGHGLCLRPVSYGFLLVNDGDWMLPRAGHNWKRDKGRDMIQTRWSSAQQSGEGKCKQKTWEPPSSRDPWPPTRAQCPHTADLAWVKYCSHARCSSRQTPHFTHVIITFRRGSFS